MSKLTLQEIARILVDKNKMDPKEANAFATAMFDLIQDRLNAEGLVKVKGLGTFKMIQVEARESVSVRTGERVLIDSHVKVSFTPDAVMKELVNKPFSQFETVVLNDQVDFSDLNSSVTTPDEELAAEQRDNFVDVIQEIVQNAPIIPEEEKIDPVEETPNPVVEVAAKETPVEEPVKPVVGKPADTLPPVELEQLDLLAINQQEEGEGGDDNVNDNVNDNDAAANSNDNDNDNDNDAAANSNDNDAAANSNDNDDNDNVNVNANDNDIDDDDEGEEESSKWKSMVVYGLVTVLLMAASAYAGFWYGQQCAATQSEAIVTVDSVKTVAPVPAPVKADTVQNDTIKADTVAVKVEEPKTTNEKPQTEQQVAVTDPYAAKDVRVRTGAYRIVGLAREVTVRNGDNLERISRRELGEGMSCYMEVYNGITPDTPLKAGTTLKVPQLQLKKKRK